MGRRRGGSLGKDPHRFRDSSNKRGGSGGGDPDFSPSNSLEGHTGTGGRGKKAAVGEAHQGRPSWFLNEEIRERGMNPAFMLKKGKIHGVFQQELKGTWAARKTWVGGQSELKGNYFGGGGTAGKDTRTSPSGEKRGSAARTGGEKITSKEKVPERRSRGGVHGRRRKDPLGKGKWESARSLGGGSLEEKSGTSRGPAGGGVGVENAVDRPDEK